MLEQITFLRQSQSGEDQRKIFWQLLFHAIVFKDRFFNFYQHSVSSHQFLVVNSCYIAIYILGDALRKIRSWKRLHKEKKRRYTSLPSHLFLDSELHDVLYLYMSLAETLCSKFFAGVLRTVFRTLSNIYDGALL